MTELRIEALAAGGRGIARPGGKVWFVAGGLPGDRVEATRIKETASFVEARAVRVLAPGPGRREPPCRHQTACGGCPWMPLPEPEQRLWKERLVADALRRVGGLADPPLARLVAAGPVLGYRNKVELTLGRDSRGRPALGYHAADASAGIVDVERCEVLAGPAAPVLDTIRESLLRPGNARAAAAFDARVRIVLRAGAEGRVLVGWRETGSPLPAAEALAEAVWSAHRSIVAGVVRIRSHPGRRGGARSVALRGVHTLRERLAGIDFRLPAATFLQVNPPVAEVLIGHVREACGDLAGLAVLDLYGGVGALGLTLAPAAKRVTVCEADGDAVSSGRAAGRQAGRRNVRFVRADVARFLREPAEAGGVVVANPPRDGMGRGVPEAIAALAPRRVVVVSCDPATLARDLRRFAVAGFRLERATPFDMFPQTAHVETVAVLVPGSS